MTSLKISSPSSTGALSFYVVSDISGERLSKTHTLTLERRDVTVNLDSGTESATIVWRTLGGNNNRTPVDGRREIEIGLERGGKSTRVGLSKPVVTPPTLRRRLPQMIVSDPSESFEPKSRRSPLMNPWGISVRQQRRFFQLHPPETMDSYSWEVFEPILSTGRSSRLPVREGTELLAVEMHNRKVQVGLAVSKMPNLTDDWQPLDVDWPIELQNRSDGFSLILRVPKHDPDPSDQPTSNVKARLSLALEGRRVQQLLLPLYSGGVEIIAKTTSPTSDHLDVEVLPVAPDLRLLAQTLVVSNARFQEEIEQEAKATSSRILETVSQQKHYDPWSVLLAGLNTRTFNWNLSVDWTKTVIRRFEWVTDFLVFEAWWCANQEKAQNLGRAVDLLSRARKRPNLYFAESDRTMRDILVWLSRDCPHKTLREKARHELAALRSSSKRYTWAGTQYSWVIGNSTTSGEIRDIASSVMISGSVQTYDLGSGIPQVLRLDDEN